MKDPLHSHFNTQSQHCHHALVYEILQVQKKVHCVHVFLVEMTQLQLCKHCTYYILSMYCTLYSYQLSPCTHFLAMLPHVAVFGVVMCLILLQLPQQLKYTMGCNHACMHHMYFMLYLLLED